MIKTLVFPLLLAVAPTMALAQANSFSQIDPEGNITRRNTQSKSDSLGSGKEIPRGIKVWTVDRRFGDRRDAAVDTLSHMFPNTVFTTGMRGEYNTTGNLGAPRINRIFIDRKGDEQFVFAQPYDFFLTPVEEFHFTNTLSPFTNLSYNTAGNRTAGDDHFTAKFGVNAGRRLGVGFKFDYIYGRGYYDSQSTSHFNYSMYASYLGDRYEAHLLMSTNHQKVAENGGITNDDYITHPESFTDSYSTTEIPTLLEQNWNRNDNNHVFLTHRYNVGFNRKVKMTPEEIEAKKFAIESQKENQALKEKEKAHKQAQREGRDFDEDEYDKQQKPLGRPDNAKIAGNEPADSVKAADRIAVNGTAEADSILAAEKKNAADTAWLKNEFVPVTSFIHTAEFDTYKRIYQAYDVPADYFRDSFYPADVAGSDTIFDKTKHLRLRNTFALSLLEGFNKWAKAGLKAFVASDFRHFTLPDSLGGTSSYNEHSLSVGGQLSKTQGNTLHYNVTAETWLTGEDAGQLKIDANVDLNFPLFGDTVTLAAKGFFHNLNPVFYYRHYHSRHYWWDNDGLSKAMHTGVEGAFSYSKTRTRLRVAFNEIKNYTYLAMTHSVDESLNRSGYAVSVCQAGNAISLLTVSLAQDFRIGPLNWETVVTYQKSSDEEALPLSDLNIYTNLYLKFKIAKVLKCDFGADARYFTKYYAQDYCPGLGLYANQEGDDRVETGNYPIVNVYANFHLKRTRFFVMMSHVNAGSGNRNYFLTPHYPLNGRILRFGLSWNFFN